MAWPDNPLFRRIRRGPAGSARRRRPEDIATDEARRRRDFEAQKTVYQSRQARGAAQDRFAYGEKQAAADWAARKEMQRAAGDITLAGGTGAYAEAAGKRHMVGGGAQATTSKASTRAAAVAAREAATQDVLRRSRLSQGEEQYRRREEVLATGRQPSMTVQVAPGAPVRTVTGDATRGAGADMGRLARADIEGTTPPEVRGLADFRKMRAQALNPYAPPEAEQPPGPTEEEQRAQFAGLDQGIAQARQEAAGGQGMAGQPPEAMRPAAEAQGAPTDEDRQRLYGMMETALAPQPEVAAGQPPAPVEPEARGPEGAVGQPAEPTAPDQELEQWRRQIETARRDIAVAEAAPGAAVQGEQAAGGPQVGKAWQEKESLDIEAKRQAIALEKNADDRKAAEEKRKQLADDHARASQLTAGETRTAKLKAIEQEQKKNEADINRLGAQTDLFKKQTAAAPGAEEAAAIRVAEREAGQVKTDLGKAQLLLARREAAKTPADVQKLNDAAIKADIFAHPRPTSPWDDDWFENLRATEATLASMLNIPDPVERRRVAMMLQQEHAEKLNFYRRHLALARKKKFRSVPLLERILSTIDRAAMTAGGGGAGEGSVAGDTTGPPGTLPAPRRR